MQNSTIRLNYNKGHGTPLIKFEGLISLECLIEKFHVFQTTSEDLK